jgi:hypothetical protein
MSPASAPPLRAWASRMLISIGLERWDDAAELALRVDARGLGPDWVRRLLRVGNIIARPERRRCSVSQDWVISTCYRLLEESSATTPDPRTLT